MKIGYARVSTADQSLDLQVDSLKQWGCDRIFTDTASGADCEREGYRKALASLNEGDTLIVWRLDRLSRSIWELVSTMKDLNDRGIYFLSICEFIDTGSAFGELILHLMAALAHFERALITERTCAGIAAAKARGVRFGRKPIMDDMMLQEARFLVRRGMSVSDAATHIGVSRATLYRHLRRPVSKNLVDLSGYYAG